MSNCSLKPTNNAGWKVPLLEGAPHCCCWVLQPRVVQNANGFFSKGFENPDSRLFSRFEYNVTIQSFLTLKTSMATFLDMSKWACVLTCELAVPHNRFLWSNIASWRSVQRHLKQVACFPQKIGWTSTSRGFSCEPCGARGRVGRLSARLQTW